MNGHLKHYSYVILSARRRKATAEVEEHGQCTALPGGAFPRHSGRKPAQATAEVEEHGQCAALPGGLLRSGAFQGVINNPHVVRLRPSGCAHHDEANHFAVQMFACSVLPQFEAY